MKPMTARGWLERVGLRNRQEGEPAAGNRRKPNRPAVRPGLEALEARTLMAADPLAAITEVYPVAREIGPGPP
jgi:hypothetical protein